MMKRDIFEDTDERLERLASPDVADLCALLACKTE